MSKYFGIVSHYTKSKNLLQHEVWGMLDSMSNKITDDLELSIVELRNKIIDLNEKHSRCQPLYITEAKNLDRRTIFVRLANGDQGPGINFTYHLIKG